MSLQIPPNAKRLHIHDIPHPSRYDEYFTAKQISYLFSIPYSTVRIWIKREIFKPSWDARNEILSRKRKKSYDRYGGAPIKNLFEINHVLDVVKERNRVPPFLKEYCLDVKIGKGSSNDTVFFTWKPTGEFIEIHSTRFSEAEIRELISEYQDQPLAFEETLGEENYEFSAKKGKDTTNLPDPFIINKGYHNKLIIDYVNKTKKLRRYDFYYYQ